MPVLHVAYHLNIAVLIATIYFTSIKLIQSLSQGDHVFCDVPMLILHRQKEVEIAEVVFLKISKE